jgi:SNF2 family DNA or RNA helicase
MCRDPLDASKVFVAAAFKPIDVKEEENVDELDLKVDMDLGENMPPSTKMQEVLYVGRNLATMDLLANILDSNSQLIEGWRVSAPQDKILIFSQFVSMIDLLAAYLRDHDIDVSTYTGKMSKDDRDDTLDEFRRLDGPKVCIISTKAGGVGLNLVCANKVILLDHTWTYAATAQAVDRAWRIGQTKPVEVVELSIGNTIELHSERETAERSDDCP